MPKNKLLTSGETKTNKGNTPLMSNITKGVKAGVLAALLITGVAGYSQTKAKTSTGVKAPSSVPVKKPTPGVKGKTVNYTQAKETLDITNHELIATTSVSELIKVFGVEKATEVVRQHMLIELNIVRAQYASEVDRNNPAKALVRNAILDTAAQRYTDYSAVVYQAEIDSTHLFSHYDKEGRAPWDRIKAAGGDFTIMQENLGYGQTTLRQVVYERITYSPGHRANILDPTHTHLGVGVTKLPGNRAYWALTFGGY